jgi:hydroxymethylbilane synthase
MEAVQDYDPALVPELVAVDYSEAKTGKVFDLSALDRALLEGRADLAAQSLDSMPFKLPPGLPIVAVGRREDARTALVAPLERGVPDQSAPTGVRTGGQLAQMAGLYPNRSFSLVTGSAQERLSRLDCGEFGAMLFSVAELAEIRGLDRAYEIYSVRRMLPFCGQGIIAVQARLGENMAFLSRFHDVDCWDAAMCERSFAEILGEKIPLAVYAAMRGDRLSARGMMADKNGRMWTGEMSGGREDAEKIGAALAAKLRLEAAGPRPLRRYEN